MKRIWAGLGLIGVGAVLALLPYHIGMTGLVFAGYGVLCLADWLFEKKRWKRGWRTMVKALGIAVFVLLAAGMSIIGLNGRSQWDRAKTAGYAVVLGAQIHADQPSRTLRERLDMGLRFLEENEDAALIVSGGQGNDEIMTEGSVMYAYLERKGADMSRVYCEEQAHNTRENLQYSAEIAEGLGIDPGNPVIITSEFHLCRAKYIAKTLGMEASGIGSRTTPGILMLNYTLREVFAFVKAWFVAGVS